MRLCLVRGLSRARRRYREGLATTGHKDRGVDQAGFPGFMRWFAAMEARPAVQRSNALAAEIRERMNKQAEGRQTVNIYDTKDNAARLARATTR